MAIVRLENVSLSVGATPLLDTVSAQVTDGQRIVLVGPNGSGKSTLLRALASAATTAGQQRVGGEAKAQEQLQAEEEEEEEEAEEEQEYFLLGSGSVRLRDGAEVLLVEQDALQWSKLLIGTDMSEEELREMTLPDALDMAVAASACAEDEAAAAAALEDAEAWRRLSVAAAGSALEWGAAGYDATLLGQLSPGCAVRAYLAVALQRPGIALLLLDEPTNHLDLPSIMFLQHAILASGKAVLLVSHDDAFMDAVADHVWGIDPHDHSITVSRSKYSVFRHAAEVARMQQQAAHEQQQARHARLTAAADSLRAAAAAGARHEASDHDLLQRDFRRNRAGRSGKKAKAIESRRDAEAVVEGVVDRAPLRIDLELPGTGFDSAIVMDEVVLGYNGEPLPLLLRTPISLRVDFGEHVAIVGHNGVGKSTLLKCLTGADPHPLVGGHASVGRELRFGDLGQEHESLPRTLTPQHYIADLMNIAPLEATKKLMRHGLTLRQVECPADELNPGARARVLFTAFSLRRVNALILDEPSNHLDEEALDAVVDALNAYQGTVLVVSHNRGFLEALQLARVLQLSPAGGLVEVDSIDAFVEGADEAAQTVVKECFAA